MSNEELVKVQKTVEKLAKEAGSILLKYKKNYRIEKRKVDFSDIVTSADLASESFIIETLRKHYPQHGFLSEEAGLEDKRSDFIWIVDPLDGTRSYARNLPFYNISIALEYKGKIVVGVIYIPETDELFSASSGNGASLNGVKISVSKEKELKNSFVWIRFLTYKNSQTEITNTLKILKNITPRINRIQPFSEDSRGLCGVAQGAIESFIIPHRGPHFWDVAPGILLVEEAGGIVTNIYGTQIKNRDLSRGIIASNKLHLKYLEIVAKSINTPR